MNTDNFLNLFLNNSSYLKYFAYKLTKDKQSAEDLYQETALLAFKYQHKFILNTNMKAWLSTIMKNTFINSYRKKQRAGELFDGTDENFYINSGDTSIKNKAEGKILIDELREIIASLNNDLRIPFLMSYQGYKYNEICDHLDLPLGTVKSRIFLARKKLKETIQKRYGSQNALNLAS